MPTIKLKRSATQNAVPTTSQLGLGEVALNTYDGKMFIKKRAAQNPLQKSEETQLLVQDLISPET